MRLLGREQMSLLFWLFNLGHVSAGVRVPPNLYCFCLVLELPANFYGGVREALGSTHTFGNPMVLS